MRHEISIEFEKNGAIISSIPESTYTPVLLAQDLENKFYYIDGIEKEKIPNYSIRMLDRDDQGNIYFVLSPNEEVSEESSEKIVSLLKSQDPFFRNFYDAHFRRFSIFLGEEGDSMEPAKITRPPEHDSRNGNLILNFRQDDTRGLLSIPRNPLENPVVDISERWKREKRKLFEIPIKDCGACFKAL